MEKEVCFAGDLTLEIEEIKNLSEKCDEDVRMSFSSVCGAFYTVICC